MMMPNDTALLRHLPDSHRPRTEHERIAEAQIRATQAQWINGLVHRFRVLTLPMLRLQTRVIRPDHSAG